MEKEEIKLFIEKSLGEEAVEFSLLKKGQNNYCYLFKTNVKEFIVHYPREKSHLGSSLYGVFRVLSFFEYKNITFVPKPIFYDREKNILVQEKIKGNYIPLSKLSKELVVLFSRQLARIHNLDFREFIAFCKKKGFEKPKISYPKEELEVYGFKRFEEAKASCPSEEILNLIGKRLEENKLLLSNLISLSPPSILWGDIGDNVIVSEDKSKCYFIDWEFTSIGYRFELPYIRIHSSFNNQQFDFLVEEYCKERGLNLEFIKRALQIEEKLIRTNDVVWAALMWGRTKGTPEEGEYKGLTYKRLKFIQ